MEGRKIKLPGVGMRILKSALAVSLCMAVDVLRRGNGIVFYSQLAALWCIQMYRDNTLKNAFQRITGTFVGAFFGLLYLLLYPRIVSGIKAGPAIIIFRSVLIFISIILVIYTTVVIKKKEASYFSCVVFLSIVINHIGDINPYGFVWNRFLDTLIGIVIGVAINNIRVSLHPDRETLFVSGADDILLDEKGQISAFSKVELNRMIEDGMRFTISTTRTPASLLEALSEIKFRYPVIVMDGAALYDTNSNAYIKSYVISSETSKELLTLIKESGCCHYTNVIIDDTLLIYYQDMTDPVNCKILDELKISPFRNYIRREFPGDENVVYFMILDEEAKIISFYNRLVELGYDKRLKIITYPSRDYKGYSYIKIYNKNASKERMLQYLKEKYEINKVVTMGTVDGKYDVLIHENSFNEMVRIVRRRYEPFF